MRRTELSSETVVKTITKLKDTNLKSEIMSTYDYIKLEGKLEGKLEVVLNLHKMRVKISKIAAAVNLTEEEVKAIIENYKKK